MLGILKGFFTLYTCYKVDILQVCLSIIYYNLSLRELLFMLSSYLTVKTEGSTEIIIQKSRFIGYIRRVETEEAAQSFIQDIKKKDYDATHNCSAYLVGEHDQIQKANDDVEPSRTAGVPMRGGLIKQQVRDAAVVVTRYFGGTKLGAGGLIRAYGNTTSEAIRATGVVKRQLMQGFSVTIDYTLLGKLRSEEHTSELQSRGHFVCRLLLG